MFYILLAATGFAAGITTGMGLGGIILIPALTMLLGFEQKAAQGINLLYFIPTSVIALIVHIKNKSVDFSLAKPLVIWGVAGAVTGTLIVGFVPAHILRRIFAVLLLLIGAYQIFIAARHSD